jgi:hypothetical protein
VRGRSQCCRAALPRGLAAHKTAYDKAQQALNQGWIHVRNEAAHGKPEFASRTTTEVRQMVAGIRAFIAKYPA